MVYLALLRGINVGGKAKVDMKTLKEIFENLGMQKVTTYINSGNIVFVDNKTKKEDIVKKLENAIEKEFRFFVKVLIKDLEEINQIEKALPKDWVNDSRMKCDVMFLWDDVDNEDVLKQLNPNPDIEDVKYTKGAVLWRVDKENITKSKLIRIIGTELYKKMTIRNCNTFRKLKKIMNSTVSELK